MRPPQTRCGVRPSSLLRHDDEAAAELHGGRAQFADEHVVRSAGANLANAR